MIAVESTYNWYWLVDGLQDPGYEVRLANPAAMQQYNGLKHADDRSDAFSWRNCCAWRFCQPVIYVSANGARCGICCGGGWDW